MLLHTLLYPSCSAFSTVCAPFLHAFPAIFRIWAILTPKSTKISYYKLHKLVNARRRGMMVSRIKMMHEVVMEWLCTLLVIVWKEEHALSFECIIIIAVNMYLCCIYTHTTVDVQVTFFVLRKSLYLVYQVSSTLYIYIKKYLRRVFIYLLLCCFEN